MNGHPFPHSWDVDGGPRVFRVRPRDRHVQRQLVHTTWSALALLATCSIAPPILNTWLFPPYLGCLGPQFVTFLNHPIFGVGVGIAALISLRVLAEVMATPRHAILVSPNTPPLTQPKLTPSPPRPRWVSSFVCSSLGAVVLVLAWAAWPLLGHDRDSLLRAHQPSSEEILQDLLSTRLGDVDQALIEHYATWETLTPAIRVAVDAHPPHRRVQIKLCLVVIAHRRAWREPEHVAQWLLDDPLVFLVPMSLDSPRYRPYRFLDEFDRSQRFAREKGLLPPQPRRPSARAGSRRGR